MCHVNSIIQTDVPYNSACNHNEFLLASGILARVRTRSESLDSGMQW